MRGLVCEMEDYQWFGLYLEEGETLIPQIGTYKIPVYYCVKTNDEGKIVNYNGVVQTDTSLFYRPIFNILSQPELTDLEKQALDNGLRLEQKDVYDAILRKLNEVKAAAETMTKMGNANLLRL